MSAVELFWLTISKFIELVGQFWPMVAAFAAIKLIMDMVFSVVYKRGRIDV